MVERKVLLEYVDDQPGRDVIILIAVFFEGGLAPLSLLLGWWTGHPPLEQFAWSVQDALWGLLATVPLLLGFVAMLRWPIGPLSKIKTFCDREVVPLLTGCSLSEIGMIAVSAGVGEELLFRGVIQQSLGDWLGIYGGFLVCSLLFGLMHPISIPYVVVTAFLGFYLGGVFLATGNLITAIVTHGVYDFVLLVYLLRYYHPSAPLPPTDPIPIVGPDEEIDRFRKP